MALARVVRAAVAVAAPARVVMPSMVGVRTNVKWEDKERAAEKAYFNKQEEQLLRTMLKKMKSQAEVVDPVAAKVVKEAERASLLAIVGKYKLAEEDIQKLIDWRHDSH